jgi:two-component system nitrate/nitrite response regulator NarL
MGEVITVVVADDHPVFRDGVVRAVQLGGRATVVATCVDGASALAEVRARRPDVAVLDQRMPGATGTDVAAAAAADGLPTRVLVLSAFEEPDVVYRALESGVAGYLTKDASPMEIADAVVALAAGRTVLPSELMSGLAGAIRGRARETGPTLTDREREVLSLAAEGRSAPEIAKELFLGVTTVKTHLARAYEKLGVGDRAAAVAEAMRRGLLR